MLNHSAVKLFVKQRIVVDRLESHRVQAVTPGQLGDFLERHTVCHDFLARAVQNFLSIPTPYALPSFIWIDLERVEHHDQTGRSAVGRVSLRRELLGKFEVVLHGASHQGLLEQPLAGGRREGDGVPWQLSHVDAIRAKLFLNRNCFGHL